MAVESYKCPNCDAGLVFDPQTQKMVCGYCGSAFTKEELEARLAQPQAPAQSRQAQAAPAPATAGQEDFTGHSVAYTCPSCGAEIVTDDTTTTATCFYCHNPVVLAERLSGAYRPQKLIPFQLDRKRVEEIFHGWCRKKWFIDRRFCAQAQVKNLAGVYVPFWLVDSQLNATLTATGTKVRVWRTGDTEYTETKIYQIIRQGQVTFQEIPIEAQRKQTMELVQGVYPYDFSQAKDFSMPYLSGFQAEKRTLERADLEGNLHGEIARSAQSMLQNSIQGYAGTSGANMQAGVQAEDWKYCLLPAWILTYRYQNKEYYFAMNGQTGKIYGEIPVSKGRLIALFLAVSIGLLILGLLGGGLA